MCNFCVVYLVMKFLVENGVVGVGNGDVIDNEIMYYLWFFIIDENLCDGVKVVYCYVFNYIVWFVNI